MLNRGSLNRRSQRWWSDRIWKGIIKKKLLPKFVQTRMEQVMEKTNPEYVERVKVAFGFSFGMTACFSLVVPFIIGSNVTVVEPVQDHIFMKALLEENEKQIKAGAKQRLGVKSAMMYVALPSDKEPVQYGKQSLALAYARAFYSLPTNRSGHAFKMYLWKWFASKEKRQALRPLALQRSTMPEGFQFSDATVAARNDNEILVKGEHLLSKDRTEYTYFGVVEQQGKWFAVFAWGEPNMRKRHFLVNWINPMRGKAEWYLATRRVEKHPDRYGAVFAANAKEKAAKQEAIEMLLKAKEEAQMAKRGPGAATLT
eukprot:TRINITY_DN60104_c0_g1_i1.p1 TRINITY_DN60104_c0_g1~~TRINITY_DN60104_c0_g1_i1.p1  ORF type:complete len:313 (+),score=17.03 TRINITY_DN60104_c0_g1_i1:30-968(+)